MKEAIDKKTSNALQLGQELPSELQREIVRAINGIRFGSVEITVHDSKVVQIERKEKVRFQQEGIAK
jgi:hypothetical protein